MDEPPQEGLDPKLAALTDLAAAGNDNILPLNDDDDDYIAEEESSRWLPITHHGDNQPPQVGQDPKLMECVNVGIDVPTDHTTAAAVYQEMDSFIPQHITQHADTPTAHDFVQQSIEPNYNTTTDYLPEEFVTTQTTVKEEEVHINTSSTSASNSKTTAKMNMNINPKLTNKESLAEWNRIHDPTFAKDTKSRQYNFYEKQQDKKLYTPPDTGDDDFPIDEIMKSSCNETNSELANAIDSVSNPTLPPKTRSNFWKRHEEERFLRGLQMYGWGQWKRIQTIVETRTNKQIKSHAQKRAKVNPGLKLKYSKGRPPSTKGRISSKVLAEDARIRVEARMPPYLQPDPMRMPPPDNDNLPYSSSAIPLTNENTLPRRVYARSASDNSEMCTWSLAGICSKEGDVANPSVTTICVKYDNGFEDNVPLECIMNEDFYEQLIKELENAYALPQSSSTPPPPLLDAGTPVYCQWMDPHMPIMHARWFPGTAMSRGESTYEVLLDNGQRRENVLHQYVLSRPDYEERLQRKQNEPHLGNRSAEEIYNYFNGSAVRAKCGQLSGEKRATDADIHDTEPQKRQVAAAM